MEANDRFKLSGGSLSIGTLDQEILKQYLLVLGRRLSPEQLASAQEEWEMICEQRGWLDPDAV